MTQKKTPEETPKEKFIRLFGRLLAAPYSIGIAILGGISVFSLLVAHIATGGIFLYLLISLTVIISCAILCSNLGLYQKNVLLGFTDLFDEFKKPITLARKAALILGVVFAISVGATIGALIYLFSYTLLAILPFAFLPLAFTLIVILLAASAFICVSALMLKNIIIMIQTENLLSKCFLKCKDVFNFSTDPNLPHNQGKPFWRIIFERVLTIGLLILFLPASILGLYFVMNSSAPGLGLLLLKIPGAIPIVVDWVSKAIALGIAFIAQIPYTVRTTFLSIASTFEKYDQKKHTKSYFLYQFSRILSSVANAAIAASGAQSNILSDILVPSCGFVNAYTGMSDLGDSTCSITEALGGPHKAPDEKITVENSIQKTQEITNNNNCDEIHVEHNDSTMNFDFK